MIRKYLQLSEYIPLSLIYLEKALQCFFSQTVEAKNMADFWVIIHDTQRLGRLGVIRVGVGVRLSIFCIVG